MPSKTAGWVVIGLALGCGSAWGQNVVSLLPNQDASLFQEGELSNGSGDYLFTGTTLMGARRRAMIQFDFSPIPAGASIDEVRLEMSMSRTISGTLTVTLHRLLADWGEGSVSAPAQEGMGATAQTGDATWTHRRLGAAAWTMAGGDYDPGASGSTAIRGFGRYSWSSDNMAADVQAWLDGGSTNFGWIVIGNEAAGFGTAKRFDSRENPDPITWPRLLVSYSGGNPIPPAPRAIHSLTRWGVVALCLVLMFPAIRRLWRLPAVDDSHPWRR